MLVSCALFILCSMAWFSYLLQVIIKECIIVLSPNRRQLKLDSSLNSDITQKLGAKCLWAVPSCTEQEARFVECCWECWVPKLQVEVFAARSLCHFHTTTRPYAFAPGRNSGKHYSHCPSSRSEDTRTCTIRKGA